MVSHETIIEMASTICANCEHSIADHRLIGSFCWAVIEEDNGLKYCNCPEWKEIRKD